MTLTGLFLVLWISPNQIKIMTLNDSVKDYAKEVYDKFFALGFEVCALYTSTTS